MGAWLAPEVLFTSVASLFFYGLPCLSLLLSEGLSFRSFYVHFYSSELSDQEALLARLRA